MLAYEWERVHTRNELRELKQRIGVATNADADTGLPGRARFLDLLEREWKLARRGTVETMAVCFRVEAGDEPAGSPLASWRSRTPPRRSPARSAAPTRSGASARWTWAWR